MNIYGFIKPQDIKRAITFGKADARRLSLLFRKEQHMSEFTLIIIIVFLLVIEIKK